MTHRQRSPRSLSTAAIAAIVVVVVVVVSVGGYYAYISMRPKPVTVYLYVSLAPSELSFYENTLVPQFEKEHPHVILKVVQFSSASDEAEEVLTLEKSGSVPPLLVQIDNMVVGQLLYGPNGTVQSGYVIPLNPYLSQLLSNVTLVPSVQHVMNYETTAFGGIYFIPVRLNVPLVFYNATVFAKYGISPPETWGQLLNVAALIYNKTGVAPIDFQGHGGASTPTELFQWMTQAGGNPLLFNDSGDVYAMEFLYNLSKYFSPRYTTGYWGSYKGLVSGVYYILDYQWPYIYGVMESEGVNMSHIGVYPGPKGPVNAAHLAGGDVLVIPKNEPSADLKYVLDVAQLLLSTPVQHDMLVSLGWPVVNSEAYTNIPSNMSVLYDNIEEAIDEGLVFRPPVPWITEWNSLMDRAWTQIIVDHAPYNEIPSILSYYNQQMYDWLKTNVGPQVAEAYEKGYYGPLTG